ncbi:MAG: hypothetical protein JSS66_15300 [Armatimonadetes bacterium]|nr:hypothetical protein [Armatimonadota bacterium]
MPISSVGSWLPTIDEFLAHWTDVNAALAPGALTLLGAYNRASLVTDRAAVETAVTDVQNKDNTTQIARGDRDVKRANVKPRFVQFRGAVNGQLPGTRYIPAIPRTPAFTDSPGVWRNALDDMGNLWTTINANSPPITGFTPPLLLAGGYAVLAYTTESTAMKTAFTTLETAEQGSQLSREQRDVVFAPVYQRLKQYRQAVVGAFPANSPLIASLPALTPRPGHTPAAVNVSASWDAGLSKARIVYTASTDPDLAEYELRACFGTSYKTSEEQVIGNNLPGDLEFLTDQGLVASGSKVFYKVYVKLTTGNEKGSKTVNVVRP